MDSKTGIGTDSKKTNFVKSYKGEKVVEIHKCPHPERTRQEEEKESLGYARFYHF